MKEPLWQKIRRRFHGTWLFPHIWRGISCTPACEHSTASFSHPCKFCTCGAESYKPFYPLMKKDYNELPVNIPHDNGEKK